MKPIGPQLEQQTLYKFRAGWEFIVPAVMLLQLQKRAVGRKDFEDLIFDHILLNLLIVYPGTFDS